MQEISRVEDVIMTPIRILQTSAACGSTSFSDDGFDMIDVPLPESEAKRMSKDRYAVWASGDSMLPEIEPGDLAIVDTSKNVGHQDLAIASHCGDMLIKRLIVNNFSMFLRSNNPKYDDIKIDGENTQVIGQVVWICKKKC